MTLLSFLLLLLLILITVWNFLFLCRMQQQHFLPLLPIFSESCCCCKEFFTHSRFFDVAAAARDEGIFLISFRTCMHAATKIECLHIMLHYSIRSQLQEECRLGYPGFCSWCCFSTSLHFHFSSSHDWETYWWHTYFNILSFFTAAFYTRVAI